MLSIQQSTINNQQFGRTRKAFSFTEVMFAVIILGIGFIMVAAIFPVAIQQTKQTGEESNAAQVARGALNYLEQIGEGSDTHVDSTGTTAPLFPATGTAANMTGQMVPVSQSPVHIGPDQFLTGELSRMLRSNTVLPENPELSFSVLYRRDGNPADAKTWAPFAQVVIIPTSARVRGTYDARSTQAKSPSPLSPPAVLRAEVEPKPVAVSIENDGGGPGVDLVRFATGANVPTMGVGGTEIPATVGSVVEGAYVVIGSDRTTGQFNGHIFKIGTRRAEYDNTGYIAYELSPGSDFSPELVNGVQVTRIAANNGDPKASSANFVPAYVIGKGFVDPANGPPTPDVTPNTPDGYGGVAQDVSVYTSYVKVN